MSKPSDEKRTPDELFLPLNNLFRFTLDPCATPENTKCDKFYTIADDGLVQPWAPHRCFVNPPYSANSIRRWLNKAVIEDCLAIFILPVDTSTHWMQLVWHKCDLVYFPARRFRFNDLPNVARFATLVAAFKVKNWATLDRELELLFGGKAIWL